MKKRLLAVLFAIAMSVSLVACGSDTKELPEEETTEVEAEDSEEDDKETKKDDDAKEEEKAEAEEVFIPYVEENGINICTDIDAEFSSYAAVAFSDEEFENPAEYQCYTINEPVVPSITTIESVSASEPVDGYVDITVVTNSTAVFRIDYESKGISESFVCLNELPGFSIADYYTGIVLPIPPTLNDETVISERTVEYEGKSYDISCVYDIAWDSSWSDWEWTSEVDSYSEWTSTNVTTYSIHVPEDYDGLCMCILSNPEIYVDFESDEKYDPDATNRILDPDEDGRVNPVEAYTVVRISDLL